MKRALTLLAVLAFVLPASAGADRGVGILGVDTGSYPALRVTVETARGSAAPVLRENGLPVAGLQTIDLGQAKSIALLVDRSQSMAGSKLRDAVAAARAFVAAKQPADRIMVMAFGHSAEALTSVSAAPTDADAALAGLTVDGTPGTALWDAIVAASRKLAHDPHRAHVIIVLTDGQDVSSAASFGDAVAAAHAGSTSVYAIGIAGRGFTPAPLRDLAARTGGAYSEASSSRDLMGVYRRIGNTLANAWELRYLTAARPGDSLTLSTFVPGGGHDLREIRLTGSAGSAGQAALFSSSTWLSSTTPYFVAAAVGLLVLLASAFVFSARTGLWLRTRLEPHIGVPKRATKARRRHRQRSLLRSVIAATERAFANLRQFRALQRTLERADLPLRAAELLYVSLGSGIALTFLAAVSIGSPLASVLAMVVGLAAPIVFVRMKAGARMKAFENQLPELLITMSASLKAGHSFRHSIQAVVDEGAQPSAKEFTRVLSETQLGRPMDEALREMATRVGSKNLEFVVTAVTIQRQVGGSLASLFDMVAETVRQRQQFVRKVRGLTAMGRISAYILIALPFLIALAITALNPHYMAPLYGTSAGHTLLIIGGLMMAFGSLVLKKMVAFKG